MWKRSRQPILSADLYVQLNDKVPAIELQAICPCFISFILVTVGAVS